MGSGDTVILYNAQNNLINEVFEYRVYDGVFETHLVFPVPLQFPDGIYLNNGMSSGSGTRAIWQLFGWEET